MTLTTSIEKVSRSAVRKDGLTSDEISIVNCSIEWLEQHEKPKWRHYGTIAGVALIEGAPHALIIRAEDAHTEHQPVQDVIEGDTMRLGKRIGLCCCRCATAPLYSYLLYAPYPLPPLPLAS